MSTAVVLFTRDLRVHDYPALAEAAAGADAVLSPVAQARRFDPDGAYVRRHLPELRRA